MIRFRTLSVSAAALTIVAGTASAQAGLTSNLESVTLTAVKATSLTVTVNSGSTQNIASITDNAVPTREAIEHEGEGRVASP